MAACVKVASAEFNTAELVGYRGVVSVAFMAAVARWRGVALKTTVPSMHLWRSVVGVASLAAWFYALAHLPLATVTTLNLMSGVWLAAFVVGGMLIAPTQSTSLETLKHQGPLIAAVMGSFVGVVLVLRPVVDAQQWLPGLVGLFSGLTAALAYAQVSALGRLGEPEERTVYYFAVGSAVCGLAAMPFFGLKLPSGSGALWLVAIGVLASAGQWGMTRAFSKGATLVVISLQYSGVVFTALLGAWVFNDHIPTLGWWGIALIVACAFAATALRQRVTS